MTFILAQMMVLALLLVGRPNYIKIMAVLA